MRLTYLVRQLSVKDATSASDNCRTKSVKLGHLSGGKATLDDAQNGNDSQDVDNERVARMATIALFTTKRRLACK